MPTFEEVQQYLKDNANSSEVQELFKPTAETVNSFLDTEEGAKLLQPRLDSHFSKGLQTWKDNHLAKIIDNEVLKRGEETPETKRIKELEQRVAQAEQERTQERLKNIATTTLSEKNLPIELVGLLVGTDEDTTNKNIDLVANVFDKAIKTSVEERFKSNGRQVGNNSQEQKTITKEEFDKMTYAQKVELYQNEPETFNKLTNE